MFELKLPVPADSVLVIGTGGEAREMQEWSGGVATGKPQLHSNGGALRALSGVSVSVAGQGLDGAEVSTTTPLDAIPAGALYRASGEVTVTARADARITGRGADQRARGQVTARVFIETLEPVGDVNSLLKAGAGRAKGGDQ